MYKYRSIFKVWEKPHDNCNTATVQQQVGFMFQVPRFFGGLFVNRNARVVPLHRNLRKMRCRSPTRAQRKKMQGTVKKFARRRKKIQCACIIFTHRSIG